jgi:hypothetical protein
MTDSPRARNILLDAHRKKTGKDPLHGSKANGVAAIRADSFKGGVGKRRCCPPRPL